MAIPDRGDLVWLEFSPQAGSEQAGLRPAVVLSFAAYHRKSKLGIVCPITSREKGWPLEVRLPSGLPIQGVVLVDQIKSIDRAARKLRIVGQVPQATLDEIDARLAPLLGL
jgi:mRNA interferase MazF